MKTKLFLGLVMAALFAGCAVSPDTTSTSSAVNPLSVNEQIQPTSVPTSLSVVYCKTTTLYNRSGTTESTVIHTERSQVTKDCTDRGFVTCIWPTDKGTYFKVYLNFTGVLPGVYSDSFTMNKTDAEIHKVYTIKKPYLNSTFSLQLQADNKTWKAWEGAGGPGWGYSFTVNYTSQY